MTLPLLSRTTDAKTTTNYVRVSAISISAVLGAAALLAAAREARRVKESGIYTVVENALHALQKIADNWRMYSNNISFTVKLSRFCVVARLWDLWFKSDSDSREEVKTLIKALKLFLAEPEQFYYRKEFSGFRNRFGSIPNKNGDGSMDFYWPMFYYVQFSSHYLTEVTPTESLLFSLIDAQEPSATEPEVLKIIRADYDAICAKLSGPGLEQKA